MTSGQATIFRFEAFSVAEHEFGDVSLRIDGSAAVIDLDPGQREALGLALLKLTDRRALAEKVAAAASKIIIRELSS